MLKESSIIAVVTLLSNSWATMFERYQNIFFIVLFHLASQSALSQDYKIDTINIREVIMRWNEAHNEINEDDFNELYAPTVLFYTNDLAKKVCIEKKLSLLNKRPFHQRIASDLHLAFYEGGVVYCGFTKDVETDKDKKSYPSYLLLKKYGDRYLITGESDLSTDRNLKFHLSLGPQIHISELSTASPPKGSKFKSVYGFVVLFLLLSVAGAAIYFFRRRRLKKDDVVKFSQEANGLVIFAKENVSAERQGTTQVKQSKDKLPAELEGLRQIELEKGHTFEQFVVNRFRKKGDVFKWMDATSDKGVQGYYPASNQNPDLQYEFRIGGKSYPFSVECKFRSMTSGAIMITKDGQIERTRNSGLKKEWMFSLYSVWEELPRISQNYL